MGIFPPLWTTSIHPSGPKTFESLQLPRQKEVQPQALCIFLSVSLGAHLGAVKVIGPSRKIDAVLVLVYPETNKVLNRTRALCVMRKLKSAGLGWTQSGFSLCQGLVL